MRTRMQEALKITANVYLVLILLFLPLYVQDGYVLIGNAKYCFFRNVTLFFMFVMTVMLAVMAAGREEGKGRHKLSGTDIMVLCYGGSAVLSWCFSSDRHMAMWGAPGWYMGLLSQLMFVWIYFMISRWYNGAEGILWAFYVGAAVVMALGILNRYVFDPLSMFEGLDEWDREHLLSTIGNPNWYCGYISVALPVCICLACMEGKVRRAAGLFGSLLFFWTVLTQGSEGGYLILLAEMAIFFFWSLDRRRKVLAFVRVAVCCPLAVFLGRYCIRFRGLILVEDGTLEGLLFRKGWGVVLLLLGILYVLLWIREQRDCRDRLESGRIKKYVLRAAAVLFVAGAAVFLVCQTWEGARSFPGERSLLRIDDSWGSGRGALWRMGMGTFLHGNFWEKWVGVGPDCFSNAVYALYPVNDIIHPTGKWETASYANAHNEWLNMLVNQGILGLLFYMGIFGTGFVRLWRRSRGDVRALLGILAVAGYCAYGVVSFQQTVSTPLIFAVLGISEAMLREKNQQNPNQTPRKNQQNPK